jgi:3-deoxy-D-manno-octulosonic-acid transferase
LYTALVHALRPIAFGVVLWRGLRNRGYWEGLGERFGLGPAVGEAPTIWVHAVSLGEVTAAVPLIRALRTRHPQMPVVLTTATPTGRARARSLFGDSVATRFIPYDTPGSMRRFLGRVRPGLAVIMETELWPNLFDQCRRRGIPVVLANARLSPRSVRRYRRFGALFRTLLSNDTLVAAQSAEDAERFLAIGAVRARTHVIGNVKFDVQVDPETARAGVALRSRSWANRPAWIAGSTHAGEEELVLRAHDDLRAAAGDALLLLVPRHPARFDSVADLLRRRGVPYARRSAGTDLTPGTQVLLVDTVGELAALYASVDVAFVGGSLVPVGGHNLLEPAALGVAVITGPYQSNGWEIAQLLMRAGAALQVADAPELAAALKRLFADPDGRRTIGQRAREVVEVNRGSVQRLLGLIETLI